LVENCGAENLIAKGVTTDEEPNMKKLLSTAVLAVFFAITPLSGSTRFLSQDDIAHDSVIDRFIGTWRLAWLEEEGADGKVHRAECRCGPLSAKT